MAGCSVKRAISIPHIAFIKFDFVPAQQSAEFILKVHLAVMLLLPGDVLLHLLDIRLADGEIRITALPLEIGLIGTLFLEPAV